MQPHESASVPVISIGNLEVVGVDCPVRLNIAGNNVVLLAAQQLRVFDWVAGHMIWVGFFRFVNPKRISDYLACLTRQ